MKNQEEQKYSKRSMKMVPQITPLKRAYTTNLGNNLELELDALEEEKECITPPLEDLSFDDSFDDHHIFEVNEIYKKLETERKEGRNKLLDISKSEPEYEDDEINENEEDGNKKNKKRRMTMITSNQLHKEKKTELLKLKELTFKMKKKISPEESMVIHYISVAIRLCKLSDSRKAINEYSIKKNISIKAQAHLQQYRGLLSLIQRNSTQSQTEHFFKEAIKKYEEVQSEKGVAICKFSILRTKFEYLKTSQNVAEVDLIRLSNKILKLKHTFNNLGEILGER